MRYLGFAHGVAAIREIGYVYVDDGQKIFRLNAATVEQLVAGRPGDDLIGLAGHYPSIFAFFDTADDADRSLHAALNQ
jgi:hypothetical protein